MQWNLSKYLPRKIRESKRAKRLLKILLILFCIPILLFFLLYVLVRMESFGPIPDKEELAAVKNPLASEVYSVDSVLLGKYFIENRTNVAYNDISPHVFDALIATEDARFYKHKGTDIRSWLRVLFKTILLQKNESGGGSTISQQLAKNLYPRKSYKFMALPINKMREIVIARKLERVYSKEDILQLYLNTVPYGGAIYGIDVASKQYFNKPPVDLKIQEAAVLAGMLKATSYYHPVRNKDRAQERRNVVLNQMEKYDYINARQLDSLKKLPVEIDYNYESNNEGLATYFREHIRQQLGPTLKEIRKPDDYGYNLYTDGLKIYTTIDSRMQAHAEEAVAETMQATQEKFDKHWEGKQAWPDNAFIMDRVKESKRYKILKEQGKSPAEIQKIFETPVEMRVFSWDGEEGKLMSPLDSVKYYTMLLNSGFMMADNKNGEIRAWVGGVDHRYFKYDHVVSKRQIGSTFKPFVFAAALWKGIGPCVFFKNELVTYEDHNFWTPKNASNEYGGLYSMEGSIAHSINASSVAAMMEVGVDTLVELALKVGYNSDDIPRVPSIALGTMNSNVYEMVNAYRIFPNKGRYTPLTYIKQIYTNKGKLLLDFDEKRPEPIQAIDTIDAILMNQILKKVTQYGTAGALRYRFKLSEPFAAKTGTSQDQADAWFIGYSPGLIGGAWVGAQSPKIHFRTINEGGGARNALPVFATFFQKLYADPAFESYKNQAFEPISYDIQDLLACPDWIESLDDYHKKRTMVWFDNIFERKDSIARERNLESMQRVANEIKREREARKRQQ